MKPFLVFVGLVGPLSLVSAVADAAPLVIDAFVDGGYNQGPRASLAAVPEPSAHLLLLVASWGLAYFARR